MQAINNQIISNNYLLLSYLYAKDKAEQNILHCIETTTNELRNLRVYELSDNDLKTLYFAFIQTKQKLTDFYLQKKQPFSTKINELIKIIDDILLQIEIETDSRQANDTIDEYLSKNPDIIETIKQVESQTAKLIKKNVDNI